MGRSGEPVAVCLRVADRAGVTMGDSCVVIGTGPIGLITALMSRHAGGGRTLVPDIAPERLRLAKKLGFEPVNAPAETLAAASDGDGADVLVECSGAAPAALEMTRLVRTGGTICLASLFKAPTPVALLHMSFKELRLVGSRVYTREEFRRATALVAQLETPLAKLITRIVPLSAAGDVFELAPDPGAGMVKVLVDCRGRPRGSEIPLQDMRLREDASGQLPAFLAMPCPARRPARPQAVSARVARKTTSTPRASWS